MPDLHTAVLDEIERQTNPDAPWLKRQQLIAALRVAVQRHRPCADRMHSDLKPHCVGCWKVEPCGELRAIADALGIEVPRG